MDQNQHRDVRCLRCKNVFTNVYPNKPSGRCSCNGFSEEVPWEWCDGQKKQRQGADGGAVELTEGGDVTCPLCTSQNRVDQDLIEESKPFEFNCNQCDCTLVVDPYKDLRMTRNGKLWDSHPVSGYHLPPDLSLSTEDFADVFTAMCLTFRAQQGGELEDSHPLLGS
eukprot:TRINITY_DN19391_c0_g1_i1.p1 TRINITY_DN19391_c0_g1~~TRINITY_DN19391_c0_g1_i1.p1  ORF type:complete len:167 (+),score=20.71 TRINITY_DN19391_c0_g1_i1:224-724(+)